MTDPVAEAAAQIAAQAAEPTMLERAMETIHDLEAKVEHLIHPDAPGNAPAVVVESVTEAATAEGAGGAMSGEPARDAEAGGNGSDGGAAPAVSELPNAVATPPAGAATDAAGDVPNVALAVAAPTAEPASASSAAGASTTLPTAASSAEPPNNPQMVAMDLASDAPLHMKIAQHLESIYTLAKSVPAAAVADTSALKTHIGDILHRISNGMAVTEGELVTKLEALYRML